VDLREAFGANVRHYRKARGLKQHALADRAGLSINMVGRIERGEASPSFETIERIAQALDVPAAALFGAGAGAAPSPARGRLLQRLHGQLARLDDDALARAVKLIRAITD
jgi:transcriptional regulator with XRE-family HTH domain